MRKLFVIALVVVLIPFTTGCRLGGLWGFDDDDETTTAAAATTKNVNNVTLTANVDMDPAGVDTTGLPQSKIHWSSLTVTVGGIALDAPVSYSLATVSGVLKHRFNFKKENVVATTVTRDASENAVVQVFVSGTQIATATVPVSTKVASTSTATAATTTLTITVTQNAGGTFTVTVTYTAPTTTTPVSVTPITPTTAVLLVEAIEYKGMDGNWYGLAGAKYVPSEDTMVRFRFNMDVADATTTFSFTAAGQSSTLSLSQADLGDNLSASYDSTTYTLTFTLAGANASKLVPGHTYTVTYNSSSITKKGDSTVKLSTAASTKNSFTTLNGWYKWNALDSAGTVLATGSIYDITTPSIANAAVASVSKILLSFGEAMTTTDMTSVTFGKNGTTFNYSDFFGTPVWSTDKKSVTIPFLTGKALSTGKTYAITAGSGTFKDANGVTISTSSVTFKTL